MQLVEKVLGNIHGSEWKSKLEQADVDILELSQWDAQKNRLRKDTQKGKPIAISLDRDVFLHDGDILLWNEETREAVVCRIDLCEVLVIDLSSLQKKTPEQIIEQCVQLGHALGNQHWPAVVKNGHVYVPLAVNRLVMNSVMNTHHFNDVKYTFIPGAEVVHQLDPAESRKLFGGTERPMTPEEGHSHEHSHHHGHKHGHNHGMHEHSSLHGHDHTGHCHA